MIKTVSINTYEVYSVHILVFIITEINDIFIIIMSARRYYLIFLHTPDLPTSVPVRLSITLSTYLVSTCIRSTDIVSAYGIS